VTASLEVEKRKEQERLAAIQAENERLRKEKEELEKQARQPAQDILKEKITGQGTETAIEKELIMTKNEEIERLIEQVLKSQAEKKGSDIP
jgi:hypothetical protein